MTKTTSIVLDVELHKRLKQLSLDSGESLSTILDRIIREALGDKPEIQEGPVKPVDIVLP